MILKDGLLDYRNPPKGKILFTGNSYIRKDGALVMGRGAALQVRYMYPDVQYDLGRKIKHLDYYGILWTSHPTVDIGVFQVKYSYRDSADIDLIGRSSYKLEKLAKAYPEITFSMNYPGTGNGRLNIKDVEKILCQLPDNIEIYK